MARVTKTVPERRQEIIDTARELFAKNGFEKTQVSDIVEKMGVAQGLVYHYFKSKKEILYGVIDEIAKERQESIEKAFGEAEGTALQRLDIFLHLKLYTNGFEKLIPGVRSDAAIVDYCSKKVTENAMPLLLKLIEQGNEDGSWICAFPEDAACFLLRGVSGFFEISEATVVQPEKKEVLASIIARVLNSSPIE